MKAVGRAALWLALLAGGPSAAPQGTLSHNAAQAEETPADLRQFVAEHFSRWDGGGDGSLDIRAINKIIADRNVRGPEAAVIVVAYRRLLEKAGGFNQLAGENGDHYQLTRAELLNLCGDRKFQKAVAEAARKLQAIDRRPFAPGDPDLSSFHQGRLGDCYLLGAIAAAVHRDPQAVRDMILPGDDGGYQVVFGDGRVIQVPAITDAELLLGARMDGTHGIWLAVLEKAYGIVREQDRGKSPSGDPAAAAPTESIGGGKSGPIIALLTGHDFVRIHPLSKSSEQQLHLLLMTAVRRGSLVCCGTPKGDKPAPGLTPAHVYAVFGYDSARRLLQIFNPHGNEFKPKGTPGPVNGYPTSHGVFNIPLADFRKLFGGLVYETAAPVRGDRRRR